MTAAIPPPCDLDAEASVLSALLIDPERIADVQGFLAPADFFSDANRHVANALFALDLGGEQIDETTVVGWLKRQQRLEQVGGIPYLSRLIDSTPAVAHVADHARIVADAARIRRVQAVCLQVRAEGYQPRENVSEWLQTVEARMFEATERADATETIATMRQAMTEEHDAIVARKNQSASLTGLATGLTALDNILGGLSSGVVYTLAARPGHGKTAAALQFAITAAETGCGVVFCSLEMPRDQLASRAIAQRAAVNLNHVRRGYLSDEDWVSIADAVESLGRLPMAIDDRAAHTVHGVRSSVRRSMSKIRMRHEAAKLGLIVIDYLQIMGMTSRGNSTRENDVSATMGGVAKLAKEFKCPVLLLSQLNREIEKRPDKRPKLSDLRESGAIEQDSYGVIFLYREDYYREQAQRDGKAEFIVAKNRNGPMGTANVCFQETSVRFFEGDPYASWADNHSKRYP